MTSWFSHRPVTAAGLTIKQCRCNVREGVGVRLPRAQPAAEVVIIVVAGRKHVGMNLPEL